MAFPTAKEVETASREQLGHWVRNLVPTATGEREVAEQRKILARIEHCFDSLGGWTPELSRKVGYGG